MRKMGRADEVQGNARVLEVNPRHALLAAMQDRMVRDALLAFCLPPWAAQVAPRVGTVQFMSAANTSRPPVATTTR